MQDPDKIARAALNAARCRPVAFLVGEAADVIAAALDAARAEERERAARIIQAAFGVSSLAVARALIEQTPID